MTAEANALAVIAAMNAALPAKVRAYDLDEVPGIRPAEYVVVQVSRRFGGDLTMGGSLDVVGYRIVVRAISLTSVSNVRNSLERCREALEEVSLAFDPLQTTPIQFETEGDPVQYDDGWFSGDHAYTYVI